ncbi:hypothetical protein [Azospirillum cavernae]|uniref:hypothetical protein n=1 Tax=Azospirillum cavernae TaxID=2320860 RepID=UPI0011C3DE58|nr:hypothetical protein [Azospirillum cavernae]
MSEGPRRSRSGAALVVSGALLVMSGWKMLSCFQRCAAIVGLVALFGCSNEAEFNSTSRLSESMPASKGFLKEFSVGHGTAWSFAFDFCGNVEEGEASRQNIKSIVEACVTDSEERNRLLILHENVKKEMNKIFLKNSQEVSKYRCDEFKNNIGEIDVSIMRYKTTNINCKN